MRREREAVVALSLPSADIVTVVPTEARGRRELGDGSMDLVPRLVRRGRLGRVCPIARHGATLFGLLAGLRSGKALSGVTFRGGVPRCGTVQRAWHSHVIAAKADCRTASYLHST